MAPKVVSVPLAIGRGDRVDPKLAPFGVVATAKNLRVRKDGRLGVRNGYQPVNMSHDGGTLRAYDLFEYQGRLCALADSTALGYPAQMFEYGTITSTEEWRAATRELEVSPFFEMQDVPVGAIPSAGVSEADCAAGGGFVACLTATSTGNVTVLVVRDSNGQCVNFEQLSSTRSTDNARLTYAGGVFYCMSQRSDNSIDILSYTPGSNTTWQVFVSQAFTASATAAVFDIVPVENPTTGRIAIAMDRGAASDLTMRVYNAAGAAVGSDITLAGTDSISISIAADQTANQFHLQTIESGTLAGALRTYTFAGVLSLGPTATTTGNNASICRQPATAGGATAKIVIATGTANNNTALQFRRQSDHTLSDSVTVGSALITTRLIPWTVAATTSSRITNTVVFGAYVAPDISTTTDATNALFCVFSDCAHMATRDYLIAMPQSYRNVGLHYDSTTGRVAWVTMHDAGSGLAAAAVTTFARHSSARRQAAKFGDLLYVAGCPMAVYDGRQLTDPFQEAPGIISLTPSNSTGSLTNSATYTYTVHWETTLADGSFWVSAPSTPLAVTMGASDDTVTAVVSTPHCLAAALGNGTYGAGVTAVLSRTVYAGGVEGSIFRRTIAQRIPTGMANYGDSLSIEDTTSDADLADEEALYTQSSRGALSGPLPHDAPLACRFVAATESRLLTAGLLRRSSFQMSKEAFLGEPFTFSAFSSFFSQVAGTIRGVFALDGTRLVFTADEIFAFVGDGPDDLGGGEIGRAQDIPSPSGLKDWRSLLKAPDGLFFQLDDSKLYRLPRGGGAPEWIGVDVQDTLASFPVITAAAKHRRDDVSLFACENSGSTAARIIVRSLRTGIWTEDTPPTTTNEGIEAMVGFGDSVAYASGGAVYIQSTSSFADTSSTFIETQIKTHPIYPFGLGGYGACLEIMLTGEYRGAHAIAARVSFDDGVSFTSLGSYTVSGLTTGQTIQRKWALPQDVTSSLVVEFTTSAVSGATEGLVFNELDLLVTPEAGLRELLPAEMS